MSLNPHKIGRQLCEILAIHRGTRQREAQKKALEWLQKVGIRNRKKIGILSP